MNQLAHSEYVKSHHDKDIVVLCDALELSSNVGGVLRLCDAFGVKKVMFLNSFAELTRKSKAAARGTHNTVNYEFTQTYSFENEDRFWFNLELTSTSEKISSIKVSSEKIGIIIGNEKAGVSDNFLKNFPSYHIDMYGENSSMNVSSALAIALYQVVNRL